MNLESEYHKQLVKTAVIAIVIKLFQGSSLDFSPLIPAREMFNSFSVVLTCKTKLQKHQKEKFHFISAIKTSKKIICLTNVICVTVQTQSINKVSDMVYCKVGGKHFKISHSLLKLHPNTVMTQRASQSCILILTQILPSWEVGIQF